MKFLFLLEGESEGCDYTLGCNINFEIIEATSQVKAVKMFYDEFIGSDLDTEEFNESLVHHKEEYGLEKITIYKIEESEIIDLKFITENYQKESKLRKKELEEEEILRQAEIIKQNRNSNP